MFPAAKIERSRMSLDHFLAAVQSIGNQIDHLALNFLADENRVRYLQQRNLALIQLQNAPPKPVGSDIQDEPSLEENSSEDDKQIEADDSETQIMSRKELLEHSRNQITIQSLSNELDGHFDRIDLWLQRGLLWQEQGDYAAALSDFIRAYQLDTSSKDAKQALQKIRKLCRTQGKTINIPFL